MVGRRATEVDKLLRRITVIRPTLVQMHDRYASETAEHNAPADLKAFLSDNNLVVVAVTYAVQVFMIMSGFVMTHLLATRREA